MDPARRSLLVVDDDELNRDMLSRRLVRKGFDVALAADGYEALRAVERGGLDLVVLDVMMPGLNGVDVLREIRRTFTPAALPVIMATARDGSAEVVEALALGASDYVTKPIDFPVVLARIETQLALKAAFDEIRRLEQSLADRNRSLTAANRRMGRDLEAAARVQLSALPPEDPTYPGVEFAWLYQPCEVLAGDFLNVVPLGGGLVAFYVLDVSGHGVASSLLAVTLGRLLSPPADRSTILVEGPERRPVAPSKVLDELNRRFPFDVDTEQFFTIFYGVLETATGRVRYASAGHPGPILLPGGGSASVLDGAGFPVGLVETPVAEHELSMAVGDRLVVYSDGLLEAAGPGNNNMFGTSRIAEALQSTSGGTLRESLAASVVAALEHSGEGEFADDVSVLGLRRLGQSSAASSAGAGR